MGRPAVPAAVSVGLAVLTAAGCATAPVATRGPSDGGGRLRVVAAENFWGSLAGQLGGSKVSVISIIDNPATDPHDYEPTPADARAVSAARLVLVNGVGYDPWAPKLLAGTPAAGRTVLDVGDLVGVAPGGNPHRWYDPRDVEQVLAAVTADLQKLDPADAGYFSARHARVETRALAGYHRLVQAIRTRYAGTPVGASESIVVPLARALGLDLVTPPTLLDAITEGSEPTAADTTTADAQITSHAVKVYVYNAQNATPDVQAQVAAARAAGIPVTTITETPTPAAASFQDWQVQQLTRLRGALASATGR